MIRRYFLKLTCAIPFLAVGLKKAKGQTGADIKIRLVRHATLLVQIGGKKFLVDPMLSDKDAMDPVANAANTKRNPVIGLPFSSEELNSLLSEVDAVIVTHTHRDHWDARAAELIKKDTPVICQPADEEKIKGQGFTNVIPVSDSINFGIILIHRTEGQHGKGDIAKKMGTVSGFVLEVTSAKIYGERIYIAGDTIWCQQVDDALVKFKPTFIVVNAGAAQFLQGGPITMDTSDVVTVATKQPLAKIVAVHMEAINHCVLTRDELKKELRKQKLAKRVYVPSDGEWIT